MVAIWYIHPYLVNDMVAIWYIHPNVVNYMVDFCI